MHRLAQSSLLVNGAGAKQEFRDYLLILYMLPRICQGSCVVIAKNNCFSASNRVGYGKQIQTVRGHGWPSLGSVLRLNDYRDIFC